MSYLFLMLGFLGSGKSFVATWLTPHTKSVLIRTDPLRWAMWGGDRPELYTPENKLLTSNAARYAVAQILESGQANVVFDANHNAYADREELRAITQNTNTEVVIVWVSTPLETAKERTLQREKTEGHKLFEEGLVEKMAKRLEHPRSDEQVIHIDGLLGVDDQKRSFDEQFAQIRQNSLQ